VWVWDSISYFSNICIATVYYNDSMIHRLLQRTRFYSKVKLRAIAAAAAGCFLIWQVMCFSLVHEIINYQSINNNNNNNNQQPSIPKKVGLN